MSTPVRYFQAGIPYHIYNRGNRKENIFLSEKDYRRFLIKLKVYKEKFDIMLFAYCLMSNHFHLLIQQNNDQLGITKFMLALSTSYAKYFNIKYEMVGRLFQERFQAKTVETEEYLLHLTRYIHLNPIAATPGVESKRLLLLKGYPWSSYKEYCTNSKGICDKKPILSYFSTRHLENSYSSFVETNIAASTPGVEF